MSATIKTDSFFVLRAPKLPVETLFNKQDSNEMLSAWLATPGVIEALYVASPSLLERLEQWREKPSSKQGKKVALALLRYLIRMSSRPTPFGLFSGIHTGKLGAETRLVSENTERDTRKTRLDMFLLSAVRSHLAETEAKSEQLTYLPNPSHYFIADQCRYIETYLSDDTMQYRLSAVDSDEYFITMLNLAKQRLSFPQLVKQFMHKYEEAEYDEVCDYLEALIKEGVVVPDIPLPLTGESPDVALIKALKKFAPAEITAKLEQAIADLAVLDKAGEASPEQYHHIYRYLSELPVKVQENKLFQSDTYRAFSQCELSQQELQRVNKQLQLVASLSQRSKHNPLENFVNKFNTRFEGQFVPLDVVLDDESGISVSTETGYDAPLVGGLQLGRADSKQSSSQELSELDFIIEQAVSLPSNLGKDTVVLKSSDLKQRVQGKTEFNFPYSMAVMLSLFEDEQSQPIMKFNGCYGPSAANLLGRFCHLDEPLKTSVIEHLEQEQNHSKDVIFAEIVHMPEGRPGNVIARPHLRQYEIVFMADSALDSEYQIPLNDLYVWVENREVKLWSKRLNKRIIPRLSSAHNFSARSLSAYKFLCMLQHQESETPRFSMPSSLANAAYVPRIMLDNMILNEKTWRVERKALEALLVNQQVDITKLNQLKEKYLLDEWVNFAVGDNVLTLNLSQSAMLEILLTETKGRSVVELNEVLTSQLTSRVKDKQGRHYANEIIVPLCNEAATPYRHFAEKPLENITAAPITRRFSAGSEWLSLKIYSGNTIVEQLLYEQLLPLIEDNSALFDKWFFIRYGDPDWHLRLRFQGKPEVLCGDLLPKLNQLLAPMIESSQLHKVELMTYEREVERYGGPKSMALVESLFMFDSELIAKSCQLVEEFGEDIRWRVALAYTDMLLSLFEYSSEEKLNLISSLRAGFGKEFNESSMLRKQLGNRYRDNQAQLDDDFAKLQVSALTQCDESQQTILALLEAWQQQAKPIVQAILALDKDGALNLSTNSLLSSLLHMHNNRMFKAYGREQEFVVHDMLRRKYFSQSKVPN
ncbi:lantibiotic dehydratase [Pseudoalteromonas piscicida]|uniref:Lantibiotic dehydratase n=1 Tax=Pseudoalteromonas piscicida TaxID=43662 RepID=A0A2A5JLT1_PSEO7|nr:lantibiotic dehydratase [Pseudoalteromonas piscicida]PCK30289.1 lantibiotic dehydratase [Pseudoalteromonas piscicida]